MAEWSNAPVCKTVQPGVRISLPTLTGTLTEKVGQLGRNSYKAPNQGCKKLPVKFYGGVV